MPPTSTDSPAFPSTRWSRIVGGDDGRDLEALAQSYWRPVQAYLRASLRIDDDAAADLAQEAFAWMLQVRLFDRANPARGSFRGLLKTALRNFAIEVHRRESTQRRGGGTRPVDLDAAAEVADSRTPTPDAELDAAWRRELLESAHTRLDAELTAAGRRVHYLVFRDYFLDPSPNDDADYGALAQRYGLTRIDVGNRLAYAKRRYRELLHAAVRETVTDPDELRRELAWLFGDDAVRTEARE
jgi:RNA polymerase sigma factor (sigma-70 family)